ncbi:MULTISPECIES: anti-sigma factor [Ramlibacter]|uniref:Anti-sigma factor n=1 Tax=Ramlibacter aquaticus TaxID=2780094 RepID=A0ABR9SG78_9BURK|nr:MULTISPECIES: anti-sigma factor [Ramlibacter]MBE7941355.1 anti-sigma factor [Ramlibacter aquaticus]
MDIARHPELTDRLAAAYALGTLRGGARRRFEQQARQSPALRAAALLWQERLSSMTELQQAQAPGPQVWTRIQNLVEAERPGTRQQQERGWRSRLRLWQGFGLAGALATVAAVGVGLQVQNERTRLVAELAARPEVRYVAVLSDDKATASMLVTVDPRHNQMTIKRVGNFQESPDRSLQLWALPPSGGPQSLGVLGDDRVVRLPAGENQVRVPALAVSLERKGGVPPGEGPSGPVLFKGALLPTS